MACHSITVEEHSVLRDLEASGPSRTLNARVRGRLALYRLIDEGPRGWAITPAGSRMLRYGRVEPLTPQELIFSLTPVLATAQNMEWAEAE
jgi:hypothetical protein